MCNKSLRFVSIALIMTMVSVMLPTTGMTAQANYTGPGWYFTGYEEVIGDEYGRHSATSSFLAGDKVRSDFQGEGGAEDFVLYETITYIGHSGEESEVGTSVLEVQWETPEYFYGGDTFPTLYMYVNQTDYGTEDWAKLTGVGAKMNRFWADGSYNDGTSLTMQPSNDRRISEYDGYVKYYDLDYWNTGDLLPLPDGHEGYTMEFIIMVKEEYQFIYHYEWLENGPDSGDDSVSSTETGTGTDLNTGTLPDLTFTDFSSDHWAYEYVQVMVDLGIINGYDDGSFRPEDVFNRAAFAKLLQLTFEMPEYTGSSVPYEDLSTDHWAYTFVMSAYDYLTAYEKSDGTKVYVPEGVAVREDVAVAMVKAMELDPDDADLTYLDQFADKENISENLRNHVALAVEHGVMQGANSLFRPQDPLTRAEASTLFARYLMVIKDSYQEQKDDDYVKITN